MSPVDTSRMIPLATGADFDRWLAVHGAHENDVVVVIYNKSSGKQAVGLVELQQSALCHGWVDTQTKRIDGERYAIRFVPRRPGSAWSAKNRRMARQMLEAGRINAQGSAALPADL